LPRPGACYLYLVRTENSGCPYSTGWPLLTRIFTTSPATSDSI
jgi:hypothetical protein